MEINNLDNNYYHCSYCGCPSHDVRICISPAIRNIEQTIAQFYYLIVQQSVTSNLNEEDTEELFVSSLTQRYLLRDLRVLAVTSAGAAASGINKRQYAAVLYTLYKTAYNIIINQYNLINGYVRDLIGDFDAVATVPKKFNITPILNIADNHDELENDKQDVCECAICLSDTVKLSDSVKLNCNHQFCGECLIKTLETHKSLNPCCALCRTTISNITVNTSDNYDKISQFCLI